MEKFLVKTRDGVCPCYAYRPEGAGPTPAVIMYMDGPGIRPAMLELGERLASHGYVAVVPDLFYRSGPYEPIDPKVVWSDPKLRNAHRAKYMDLATPENVMSDTAAILAAIRSRPDVVSGPVGVVGYCMGGRLALIAAGTYPDQVAVAASYHGGGLATDAPTSPHLLACRIKAKIYVARAIDDPNFTDAMKDKLEAALTDAGVDHAVETYPAKHGWVLRDMPVYDAAEAEHHWRTLTPLLAEKLKV